MSGFYYVLRGETSGLLTAALAAFPVAPQSVECTIYDGAAGVTAASFSAAAPLPGRFILAGVDEALTDEELLAVLAEGVTLSDNPNAPALQGFETRVTVTPEPPAPEEDEGEGEGEPEGDAE